MPARRNHPPVAPSHGNHLAVANAREFARRPPAEKFRPALGFDDSCGILVRRAIPLQEGGEVLVRTFLALMPHLPAAEPFGQRHANAAFHFLHEESGEAAMIHVRMRQGEVLQRTAAQQAAPELVPHLECIVSVEAAVDHGPSRPVVEQPAIDVIGRRRHRKPHPEQPRQHIRQIAIGRRALHREIQIVGHVTGYPGFATGLSNPCSRISSCARSLPRCRRGPGRDCIRAQCRDRTACPARRGPAA
jgi:hypothetical protein